MVDQDCLGVAEVIDLSHIYGDTSLKDLGEDNDEDKDVHQPRENDCV